MVGMSGSTLPMRRFGVSLLRIAENVDLPSLIVVELQSNGLWNHSSTVFGAKTAKLDTSWSRSGFDLVLCTSRTRPDSVSRQ
jgi:hypothetical protein